MINNEIEQDLRDIAIKTKNLIVVSDVINKIEAIDSDIRVSYKVASYYSSSTTKLPTVTVRDTSPEHLKTIRTVLDIKGKALKKSDEYTVDETWKTATYYLMSSWSTDKMGCQIEYETDEVEVDDAYIGPNGTIMRTVKQIKSIKCAKSITQRVKEVFSGNSQ